MAYINHHIAVANLLVTLFRRSQSVQACDTAKWIRSWTEFTVVGSASLHLGSCLATKLHGRSTSLGWSRGRHSSIAS